MHWGFHFSPSSWGGSCWEDWSPPSQLRPSQRALSSAEPMADPAQTALGGVDGIWFGSSPSPSASPWLQHLRLAGLSRTGRLDHLHPTNQSLSSGLSPQKLGDWLRLPTQSQRTRASHPSASLCHVAFPPRAGPLSSLSIPGHLSLQPSKRAAKKGSPCQHLRWEVMRSKLYFREICSPRQNLDQVG